MDAALINAIDDGGLRAHQAVLPSNASPRLSLPKLPIIKLTEPEFVKSLLRGRYTHGGFQALCATGKNAAKLLATPMRDIAAAGSNLSEAHRCARWYLAIEFLADVMGLEQFSIRHVLAHQTGGYIDCRDIIVLVGPTVWWNCSIDYWWKKAARPGS
jgi:hypothetical protein